MSSTNSRVALARSIPCQLDLARPKAHAAAIPADSSPCAPRPEPPPPPPPTRASTARRRSTSRTPSASAGSARPWARAGSRRPRRRGLIAPGSRLAAPSRRCVGERRGDDVLAISQARTHAERARVGPARSRPLRPHTRGLHRVLAARVLGCSCVANPEHDRSHASSGSERRGLPFAWSRTAQKWHQM